MIKESCIHGLPSGPLFREPVSTIQSVACLQGWVKKHAGTQSKVGWAGSNTWRAAGWLAGERLRPRTTEGMQARPEVGTGVHPFPRVAHALRVLGRVYDRSPLLHSPLAPRPNDFLVHADVPPRVGGAVPSCTVILTSIVTARRVTDGGHALDQPPPPPARGAAPKVRTDRHGQKDSHV